MFNSIFTFEGIFGVCSLISIIALLIFYKQRDKSRKQEGKDSVYVMLFGLYIFLLSFSLYFIAFLEKEHNTQNYLLVTLVKSVRASVKMFIGFDFKYGNIKIIADNNPFYCAAIIACFIAACLWMIILVKNLFFKGIINEFKVWWRAKIGWEKDKYYYIIIGCEKSMKVFLSNLEKKSDKKNIIIITGEPMERGTKSIDYFREFVEDGYAVINGKADESALKKAGMNHLNRKIRIIAITECDKQNLNVANIVTQKILSTVCPGKEYTDIEVQKEVKKSEVMAVLANIHLEAYIMYSFIERAEHFVFAENAFGKVDFFNPYELRARDFFWKHPITSLIPKHFIDISKARLKGEFLSDGKIYKTDGKEYVIKNIFVGFGNTNYQMLKGSILTGQLLGCDYHAVIYDENIPSVRQEMFMNHSSGFFGGDQIQEEEEYLDSPKEKYDIVFRKENILSRYFYSGVENCLINEVKNNDFTAIYVALGDDKKNIESACEIRQCLYEYGIMENKVRIFVKVFEESVFSKDFVINNPSNGPIKIECFGFNKTIFTKENIVNESLDEFARKVTNKNHETPWEFLPETKRDINRQVAMAIKTKLNLLGLNLIDKTNDKIKEDKYYKIYIGNNGNDKIKEIIELSRKIASRNNNIENKTQNIKEERKRSKKYLLEQEIKEEIRKLKNERLRRSGLILDYIKVENDQIGNVISDTPRNNLARLEHLRWNTFYLIHGWSKMPKSKIEGGNEGRQNKLIKQHACITTFEGLIELRELQAKKICEKDINISLEEARIKADTIWYDYNLMDELYARLFNSDKIIILLES